MVCEGINHQHHLTLKVFGLFPECESVCETVGEEGGMTLLC